MAGSFIPVINVKAAPAQGGAAFTPKIDLALPYYKKAKSICTLRYEAGAFSLHVASLRSILSHQRGPPSITLFSSSAGCRSFPFALPDWVIALLNSCRPAVPKVLQVRQRECRKRYSVFFTLIRMGKIITLKAVVEGAADMLTQLWKPWSII